MKQRIKSGSWTEQQNEKRLKKNEEGLSEPQDKMKHNNIHIIGTPKGEEEKLGQENLFEKVMTEIFPNLMRKNIM